MYKRQLYPLYGLLHAVGLTSNMVGMALLHTGGQAANIFMVSGFVRSVPTVSYTHLDVYKRQSQCCARCSLWIPFGCPDTLQKGVDL